MSQGFVLRPHGRCLACSFGNIAQGLRVSKAYSLGQNIFTTAGDGFKSLCLQ